MPKFIKARSGSSDSLAQPLAPCPGPFWTPPRRGPATSRASRTRPRAAWRAARCARCRGSRALLWPPPTRPRRPRAPRPTAPARGRRRGEGPGRPRGPRRRAEGVAAPHRVRHLRGRGLGRRGSAARRAVAALACEHRRGPDRRHDAAEHGGIEARDVEARDVDSTLRRRAWQRHLVPHKGYRGGQERVDPHRAVASEAASREFASSQAAQAARAARVWTVAEDLSLEASGRAPPGRFKCKFCFLSLVLLTDGSFVRVMISCGKQAASSSAQSSNRPGSTTKVSAHPAAVSKQPL